MPDPCHSLRHLVLEDIGKGTKETPIAPAQTIISSDIGSGVSDNGPPASGETEDLRAGIDFFFDTTMDAGAAREFGNTPERFNNLDGFLRYIVAPFVYGLRVVPDTNAFEYVTASGSVTLTSSVTEVDVTASIGASIAPVDSEDVEDRGIVVDPLSQPTSSFNLVTINGGNLPSLGLTVYGRVESVTDNAGGFAHRLHFFVDQNSTPTAVSVPSQSLTFTYTKIQDASDPFFYTRVKIRKTGRRPFLYNGHVYTYAGGVKNLHALVTSTKIMVLMLLNPANIPAGGAYDSAGAAIDLETDQTIVNDPTLWPKTKIPLAVVTLRPDVSADSELSIAEIEDVRPLISWGSDLQFREKLWFTNTLTGTTRYYFDVGVYPALPYNVNTRIFKNGQELTYGSTYDYIIGFDAGLNKYYIDLQNDVVHTGERLKAWFIAA